jgi:glycerol-3-phosphate dehydrogenase
MAEQTVDQIVKWVTSHDGKVGRGVPTAPLNVKRAFSRCCTASEPLLSGAETVGVSGILPPDVSRKVVEHYCAQEWAVHLDDVMVRRTRWHYYLADAAQVAERVADWMSEFLRWPDATRRSEVERYFQVGSFSEQRAHQKDPADNVTNQRVRHEVHS